MKVLTLTHMFNLHYHQLRWGLTIVIAYLQGSNLGVMNFRSVLKAPKTNSTERKMVGYEKNECFTTNTFKVRQIYPFLAPPRGITIVIAYGAYNIVRVGGTCKSEDQ